MELQNILLVAAALIPAIILCVYIYIKDRAEKEPFLFLLLLFVLGALCCFPAIYLERGAGWVINSIFRGAMYEHDGQTYMSPGPFYIYQFFSNFIGVALVEEGLKWIVLLLVTKRSRHFNSLFDGLIYSVFVSLGFAAWENIQYVIRFGFGTALQRAFTSVPGHMFFAVFMGYYYTLWHTYRHVQQMEQGYVDQGFLPARNMYAAYNKVNLKGYLFLSLFIPVLIHGAYDFVLSIGTVPAVLIFYGGVALLYFLCFKRIRKLSKMDTEHNQLAKGMIIYANPQYSQNILEGRRIGDTSQEVNSIQDRLFNSIYRNNGGGSN